MLLRFGFVALARVCHGALHGLGRHVVWRLCHGLFIWMAGARGQPAGRRSRGFVFTCNNPTTQKEELVRGLVSRWLLYGREVGESGTPHLQGVIWFANQRTLKSLIKKLPGFHLEVAKGSPEECEEYCSKDGDVWSSGERPLGDKEKGALGGDAQSDRWDLARAQAAAGTFDIIDSELYIKYQSAFHRIRSLALETAPLVATDVLNNFWFYGKSGSGKSREARRRFPDAYLKAKNKWWSGYQFQEVAIVDDVDPQHSVWMGAFLKEWSDHYPFQAEIKGGSFVIRPKTIVITSQYKIEDIFTDPETVAALQRRFQVTRFGGL